MWDVYRVWAMVFTLFCRYPTRVCMCVATCHTRCWRCAVMCSTASAVLCGASVLCATRGCALALPCVCRGLVCCVLFWSHAIIRALIAHVCGPSRALSGAESSCHTHRALVRSRRAEYE